MNSLKRSKAARFRERPAELRLELEIAERMSMEIREGDIFCGRDTPKLIVKNC